MPSTTTTGRAGSGVGTSGRPPRVVGRDAGAVTAELALALPAVVLVLAVLLVTAAASAAQLRAADAARTGARLAALGYSDGQVVAAVGQVGGRADVRVRREPPWVVVEVVGQGPGAWFTGGPLAVSASATAWVEP